MPRHSSYGPSSGESKGDGWGGPAKGAGRVADPRAPLFGHGNKIAAGPHDMSGADTARRMKAHIERLAFEAAREETQLSAAIAWLDRHEGKPIARNLNMDADDLAALDDGALDARRTALEAELRASTGGAAAAVDQAGPHRVVN